MGCIKCPGNISKKNEHELTTPKVSLQPKMYLVGLENIPGEILYYKLLLQN